MRFRGFISLELRRVTEISKSDKGLRGVAIQMGQESALGTFWIGRYATLSSLRKYSDVSESATRKVDLLNLAIFANVTLFSVSNVKSSRIG